MENSEIKKFVLNPFASSFEPCNRVQTVACKNLGKKSNPSPRKIKVVKEKKVAQNILETIFISATVLPVIKESILKSYLSSDSVEKTATEPYINVLFSNQISGIWKQPAGFRIESSKPDSLLVSFFGVYSYGKVACPTLKMTPRPEHFVDKVWSVKSNDSNLWSTSTKPCGCPPMLGYHIPPEFFGNPFNLPAICGEKTIHLTQYTDVLCNFGSVEVTEQKVLSSADCVFNEDKESEPVIKGNMSFSSDLKLLSKELKKIISVVCNMINEWELDLYITNADTSEISVRPEDKADHLGLRQMSGSICKNLNGKDYLRKLRNLYHVDKTEIMGSEMNSCTYQTARTKLENSSRNFSNMGNSDFRKLGSCSTPCSAWCKPSYVTNDNYIYNRDLDSVPVRSLQTQESIPLSKANLRKFSESSGNVNLKNTTQNSLGYNGLSGSKKITDQIPASNPWNSRCSNEIDNRNIRSSHYQYASMARELQRRHSDGCDSGFSEPIGASNYLDQFLEAQNSGDQPPFDINRNMNNMGFVRSMWFPFDGADSLWKDMPECIPSEKYQNNWNSFRHGQMR